MKFELEIPDKLYIALRNWQRYNVFGENITTEDFIRNLLYVSMDDDDLRDIYKERYNENLMPEGIQVTRKE